MSELSEFRKKVRQAFADYRRAEGCSCCRNHAAHDKASAELGKLLRAAPYPDGSGHEFSKYCSPLE